ncbi:MAG: chemotaxis protein CheZ [Gammaproteobacteria bacterium]|jgi:chemotaxis protein CheZ
MSENSTYLTEEYITRLKELTESLTDGDHARVDDLVAELTTLRESSLYNELGKLTRELHDAISNFGQDDRVATLTQEDIPDAKERLQFIVDKTNEAAHRTMGKAEDTISVVKQFSTRSGNISKRWKQFRQRELSKQQFVELNDDLDVFLESISTESEQINGYMNDIMLAQDYQDITGQMVKQVVEMVTEVEDKLVRLVALSGNTFSPEKKNKTDDKAGDKSGEKAEGPQLPSADKNEVASSQEDVDDLLASLGF